jgi:hypothetical protein
MEKNVGMADAFTRFQFGVAFLVNIVILEPGIAGTIILLALAFILIKSAVTGYCPAYTQLKISTVPKSGYGVPPAEGSAH